MGQVEVQQMEKSKWHRVGRVKILLSQVLRQPKPSTVLPFLHVATHKELINMFVLVPFKGLYIQNGFPVVAVFWFSSDSLSVLSSSRYLTMTAANEANGWYGGTLLGDQDESSEIYRHYAELIQVQICATFFL